MARVEGRYQSRFRVESKNGRDDFNRCCLAQITGRTRCRIFHTAIFHLVGFGGDYGVRLGNSPSLSLVVANGNVIDIVGFGRLFVAEACSGLRSLTALISLGVLMGGMWLRTVPARVLIIVLAVPVAIFLNGVRIFLTGFLMYFVSPEMGQGFMHESEGWALFVVALAILGVITAVVRYGEAKITGVAAND
jgi:exosortase